MCLSTFPVRFIFKVSRIFPDSFAHTLLSCWVHGVSRGSGVAEP